MGRFSRFFLLFLFYFHTIMASSRDDCSSTVASCGYGYRSLIRFPFGIGFSENTCAYPGFHMSCNKETNSTLIQIGSWGEFSVRNVDYLAQNVEIYDQHNCLPKRLLNIDLSGSPYRGAHYRNFTFYNCSSEFSSNVSKHISCLTTENQKVFASSNSSLKEVFSSCAMIVSVMVPSMSRYPDDTINNELHLVWDTPDCRACVGQDYGECGFKNKESRNLTCFFTLPAPKQGREWPSTRVILWKAGISLIITSIILMLCCIAARRNLIHHHHHDDHIERVESFSRVMQESMVGLDESVIQSYPTTVLGESGRLTNPEDNTCSICLSKYEAKETLRTIPSCKHCFHATCVDEWLRRNVTCPICRHSTKPRPLAV